MIAIVEVSPVEGLVCAEAWDYFRDVILLILNRDFGGADEPLALLVCTSICRVLVALVRNAPPATGKLSPHSRAIYSSLISHSP